MKALGCRPPSFDDGHMVWILDCTGFIIQVLALLELQRRASTNFPVAAFLRPHELGDSKAVSFLTLAL